jgi:uncharacterized protein YjbJ (UPF0337 family)
MNVITSGWDINKLIQTLIMVKENEKKGDWNEKKSKLKQKFAMLTDTDFLFIEGKQDEIYLRLGIKLGKTKKEIHDIISKLEIL